MNPACHVALIDEPLVIPAQTAGLELKGAGPGVS